MNNTQKNINQVNPFPCPECDSSINLPKKLIIGKVVECPACGTESEIVQLHPLKLSPLEEEK